VRAGLEQAAERASGYLERAAGAVQAGISGLLSERRHEAEARQRDRGEDDEDPLADPLEKRFRELEKKRIKID
jgi:hypothetical protein